MQCWAYGVPTFDSQTSLLCDCDRECWREQFDTSGEFDACLLACVEEQSLCQTGCSIDPTPADDDRTACLDGCDTTHTACIDACIDDYTACQAPCDAMPEGTPEEIAAKAACGAACSTTNTECQDQCDLDQEVCDYECETQYLRDLRDLYDGNNLCYAECCTADADSKITCDANCADVHATAERQDEIDYRDCNAPCIADPMEDCSGCDFERYVADHDTDRDLVECNFNCSLAWKTRYKICDDDITTCSRAARLNYIDTGDDCRESGFDDPGFDVETCVEDALKVYWDDLLLCCFNIRGFNAYDQAYVDCAKDEIDCNAAAREDCADLFPGTGPGEPCEFPGPTCTAAEEAYHDCLDPQIETCEDDHETCVDDIPGYPPCARCDPTEEG